MSRRGDTSGTDSRGNHYDVGYGKPPAEHRFAKGKSGNPKGRPRKIQVGDLRFNPADRPTHEALAFEAYRPITINENGTPTTIPAVQALIRSTLLRAIKGNAAAAKLVFEWLVPVEAKAQADRLRGFELALQLKAAGEDRLERGVPPENIIPHPDDIEVDYETAEVNYHWTTPPQQEALQRVLEIRDSIEAEIRARWRVIDEDGGDVLVQHALELALAKYDMANSFLPARLQRPPSRKV